MKRIENLWKDRGKAGVKLDLCPVRLEGKNRVHLAALGDVGRTVLTGLHLLGEEVISEIGIFDMNRACIERLEMEMGQVRYPFGIRTLPPVKGISEEDLFDCDVLILCASKSVPPLEARGDVRMAQLKSNGQLFSRWGRMAAEAGFQGLTAVVSDPVDPLCRIFLRNSGLHPAQVQGFGLGVMNARALYFAEKDPRFHRYEKEGRAFGPHGEDLVIADSIRDYDDSLSRQLTDLAVSANLKVRELGYKPYIAPALSSAAVSILLTLQGQWHYSSLYLGDAQDGAFLGIKNRMTTEGPVYEDLPLCRTLYDRISEAYENLRSLPL